MTTTDLIRSIASAIAQPDAATVVAVPSLSGDGRTMTVVHHADGSMTARIERRPS